MRSARVAVDLKALASLTLIEHHQIDKGHEIGKGRRATVEARVHARRTAGRDAAGATLGGFGLACFGAIVWRELQWHATATVLLVAALGWLTCAVLLWWLQGRWRRLGARSRTHRASRHVDPERRTPTLILHPRLQGSRNSPPTLCAIVGRPDHTAWQRW